MMLQPADAEDVVQQALRKLESNDPFADSDLPVESITQGIADEPEKRE